MTSGTLGRKVAASAAISARSDAFVTVPCLVLLGPTHSGKSHAFTEAMAQLRAAGQVVLLRDLGTYDTGADLRERIFDNPEFRAWVAGTHPLYLFLENLDECRLYVKTAARILLEMFADYPRERLFVRIACRSAEWSSLLETGLRQLWDARAVVIYELAPLRREDIIVGALARGVDPPMFLAALEQANALPLAETPLNLLDLLDSYRRGGHLPGSQQALYAAACVRLCTEHSPSRVDSGVLGTLSPTARVAVAARIAALTLFANRYGIQSAQLVADPADLQLNDIIGGEEPTAHGSVVVDRLAVINTLQTGLFAVPIADRQVWVHRSYVEFLAAHYLVTHAVPLPQVQSLLFNPHDPDGGMIPQLHGVSAAAASLRPDLFRLLAETDPEVLLQADFGTVASVDRAYLADHLLRAYDRGDLLAGRWNVERGYAQLLHPGLATQLRSYLVDPHWSETTRRVAITIAEACGIGALRSCYEITFTS